LIRQKAFIANGPDNRSFFPLRKVRAQAEAFDSLNDSLNLVLADSRLENNNHGVTNFLSLIGFNNFL
jgi:hypothetical protein